MPTGCTVKVMSEFGQLVGFGTIYDIEHDPGIAIVTMGDGKEIRVPLDRVEEVEDLNKPTTGPIGNWSKI